MQSVKIGFPGLGARLKYARSECGVSQEAVAELLDVSWITVHRWERKQRTISKDHLTRLSEYYGKSIRWFLTLEEGDLEQDDGASSTARRVYRRIAEIPEQYQTIVERVVDEMVSGLNGTKEERLDGF